jgi:hypothetical protein
MRVLREPLLHFLAAGLVLFLLGQAIRAHTDTHRILLSPQRQAELANRYALQFGTRPDERMMTELVKSDVHEEILFRQGLALGLDKDDEIIRRRIIQKMQFLLEDLQIPPEPDIAQLQAYYRTHAEQYRLPERATFTHVYFSSERGDAATRSRAQAALVRLAKDAPERATGLGDSFPDRYDFSNYSAAQVEHLFGRTEFSSRVFSVATGQWAGPFKSAYGWHLVRVQSRAPELQQPFAAVRDTVRADYLLEFRTRQNAAAFTALARQYTVATD